MRLNWPRAKAVSLLKKKILADRFTKPNKKKATKYFVKLVLKVIFFVVNVWIIKSPISGIKKGSITDNLVLGIRIKSPSRIVRIFKKRKNKTKGCDLFWLL